MNKNILIILFSGTISFMSCSQIKKNQPLKVDPKKVWVDSIYDSMSLEEKVGQLFMIAAYSNRDKNHSDTLQKLIKNHKIGGLIFFQGGPVRQAKLTNLFQSVSKVPLMIGIDGEWGLNMRLDSTKGYPYNMTLGAIEDNKIIQKIASQIGKDCKRLGIHINFAPVVDINTNPKNPIIGARSFGEDKFNVTEKSLAFMEGLQGDGVLACAKHFPGHGDTDRDSHKTLPTVSFSKERIDSVELYPYKKLFEKGLSGVMVAHLNVPSLESQANSPSSISYNIVTNILKNQLNFEGLIFTDALNMKGAANHKEPGEIDLAALKAGNDVLLFTENAPKAISKIIESYNNHEITEERLAYSVKKILSYKFQTGLNNFKPIEIDTLIEGLNKEIANKLYDEAISNAITLVKNKNEQELFTIKNEEKTAFYKLGNGDGKLFLNELKTKISITDISKFTGNQLINQLKKYDKIIISYHRKNSRLTYPISEKEKSIIKLISSINNQTLLILFASQYSIQNVNFDDLENIIISYENSENAQRISSDIIFGDLKAKGKLPTSISLKN